MSKEENFPNANPHCNDYDSEGRCNNCGQFDCYECDWGVPFKGCNCRRCISAREDILEELYRAEQQKAADLRKEKAKQTAKLKKEELKKGIDGDLESMTSKQLKEEVKKLRAGIRAHRDSSGHDLCWYHPELWNLLPDKVDPKPAIPPTDEFLHHCKLYCESLNKKHST
jgi:hypothetical protein